MGRRLNEDFRPERDDRSFNEKYGDGEHFSEAEIEDVVPAHVKKLFESILDMSENKRKLRD